MDELGRTRAAVWVLLVALFATVVIGAVPARADHPTPISSRQVGTLLCTDLLFVGARGSGEAAPYGETIEAVRTTLLDRWKGTSTSVWLDYPAVSPHTLQQRDIEKMLLDQTPPHTAYFASVTAGVTELSRVLTVVTRQCPDQRIVLAGFSQGAQVVTEVLAKAPEASAVTASLLLGSPTHYPGQNARELDAQVDSPAMGLVSVMDFLSARIRQPDPDTRRESVKLLLSDVFSLYEGHVSTAEIAATLRNSAHVVPASSYPRTFSVCQKDDLVCDAAPALSRVLASASTLDDEFARTRPVHGGYTPAVALQSLEAILGLLADSGKVVELEQSGEATPLFTPVTTPEASDSSPSVRTRPTTPPSPRRDAPAPSRWWWVVTAAVAAATAAAGYGFGHRGVRRRDVGHRRRR